MIVSKHSLGPYLYRRRLHVNNAMQAHVKMTSPSPSSDSLAGDFQNLHVDTAPSADDAPTLSAPDVNSKMLRSKLPLNRFPRYAQAAWATQRNTIVNNSSGFMALPRELRDQVCIELYQDLAVRKRFIRGPLRRNDAVRELRVSIDWAPLPLLMRVSKQFGSEYKVCMQSLTTLTVRVIRVKDDNKAYAMLESWLRRTLEWFHFKHVVLHLVTDDPDIEYIDRRLCRQVAKIRSLSLRPLAIQIIVEFRGQRRRYGSKTLPAMMICLHECRLSSKSQLRLFSRLLSHESIDRVELWRGKAGVYEVKENEPYSTSTLQGSFTREQGWTSGG